MVVQTWLKSDTDSYVALLNIGFEVTNELWPMRWLRSFGTIKANVVITYFHQRIFTGELKIWSMARACVNTGSCEGRQFLPAQPCNLISDSRSQAGFPATEEAAPPRTWSWGNPPDLRAAVSVYRVTCVAGLAVKQVYCNSWKNMHIWMSASESPSRSHVCSRRTYHCNYLITHTKVQWSLSQFLYSAVVMVFSGNRDYHWIADESKIC